MRYPFVIAPNRNMADHICNLFNIPRRQVRVGSTLNLRGFSPGTTFMIYTEGWDTTKYTEMLDALKSFDYTLIFVPELTRVSRPV